MKSKWNLAAFTVMALTVVAHAFGGGPEIWLPVYESSLPQVVRISMGLVWHGLTVLFIIMAALSLAAYLRPKLSLGINLSLAPINLGFGGVALIYGFVSTGGVLVLPQWILFLPMAVFTFMALKAMQKSEA
ncbi:MAG: hypothetical protein COB13_004020 [OCS116 cluster bacterium]|nr:hypothetical protein [OCS116 cluster bacterium]